jgi:hypothetical protein
VGPRARLNAREKKNLLPLLEIESQPIIHQAYTLVTISTESIPALSKSIKVISKYLITLQEFLCLSHQPFHKIHTSKPH